MTPTPKTDALLDCRSFVDYCRGHLQGACSLPADELFARMHELPQRSQTLCLCGMEYDLEKAQAFLQERDYHVAETIVWTPELEADLQQRGVLECGPQSARLWEPAPLVADFVQTLMPQYGIEPSKGLDIACGAGRDLVYLALHGWQMTGLDASADALQRVQTLAAAEGVTVATQQCDLEKTAQPLQAWQDGQFGLVHVARYLHRPLLSELPRLLQRGGILIYQTFMVGCEQTAIGRPSNPRFLLQDGELATTFASADILLDRVDVLADGRPFNVFVARF